MLQDFPVLTLLPTAQHVFVGIDVAKNAHVAGFVTSVLLSKHRRFDRCPTVPFENSRLGFEKLIETMQSHAPLSQCAVLMEHTGHYGAALLQYLQERDIKVYMVHATKRMTKDKTDKRDAQSLANILYNQVSLGVQVLSEKQRIRCVTPPTETSLALRSLVRRRYELSRDIRQRCNKLIAIIDEMFPEFVQIFKNPCLPNALNVRVAFPTPALIAEAQLDDLLAVRQGSRPSRANLMHLQELAMQTIGTKNQGRIYGLVLEQRQLIDELRMLENHCDTLDAEIEKIVIKSREGRILMSMPSIGTGTAAEIIAAIGNISNFENASKLRGYFGWNPVATQTGESKDSTRLDRGGRRPVKKAMYLLAWRAIQIDTVFRSVYQRLIKLCRWDERKKKYVGKNKVIGRIAGQCVGVIFALLKRDHDLLVSLAAGEEPPEPMLYNREMHRAHRSSHKEGTGN